MLHVLSLRQLALILIAGASLTSPLASAKAVEPRRPDGASGKQFTVTASVEYSTEGITGKDAALRPGAFTVPAGHTASELRYRWTDPKTDRQNDRITASTVYSVSERRYMTELKGNPNAVLPAGDYKLVVGGLPGAMGVLTYRLTKADAKPETAVGGERIIDVETWLAKPPSPKYNPKLKATYRIRDGKVTGAIDQLIEPPQYDRGITCDPLPTKGAFAGTIAGNVITGKWEVKTAAHKMHFPAMPGTDYPAHDRTDTFSHSYEARLTLNPDGTLTESLKGTSVVEWQWGPTAPKSIAGERGSHRNEFTVPDKDQPEPMQGTWKERK